MAVQYLETFAIPMVKLENYIDYMTSSVFKYWENFYSSKGEFENLPPSQFSVFTMSEIRHLDTLIIEFGCGNGRDSAFFSKYGMRLVGIDSSKSAINICKNMNLENAQFYQANASDGNTLKKIRSQISDSKDGPTIYARFFLHAINQQEETEFLKNCMSLINKRGRIFLEFRTEKDQRLQKITTDHYRRYISPAEFMHTCSTMGLKIIYFVEGFGYAKYKDDDAHVARVIIEKK